jgi:protease-4
MSTAPNNPIPNIAGSPSSSQLPPGFAQAGYPATPIRVIVEQPRISRWGGRIAWVLVLLLVLVIVAMYGSYRSYLQTNPPIQEKYHSLNPTASDKIAIITVDGTIIHTDGFAKWQIDQVRKDDRVKAVVLRVDSPGGTITGSDYLYHHLVKLRKERGVPLVVSMGGMAASGGYYISMAVGDQPNTIFAEPTTWTGSIGVVIPHYDFSKLLKKWDIEDDSIASHPLKLIGSPTRDPPEEVKTKEREILNALVKMSFDDFKEIVKSGRPALAESPVTLDEVATGQIFTAKQAQKLGLVDQLGFVEDAVDRAIELAQLDKANVRVVKYDRPKGFIESLIGSPFSKSSGLDLGTLLDLSAPRAYYLCTWLPAVESSGQ